MAHPRRREAVTRVSAPGIGLPRVFSPLPVADSSGARVTVDEAAVRHLRVRRVQPGDRVGVSDGAGGLAEGVLVRLERNEAWIEVERSQLVKRPPAVHLLAPVGDRDRMLWLAEKATELGLTSWRSVVWHRSRSVTPRGEGASFQAKLHARMVAALLQSGAAWLPELLHDLPAGQALATVSGTRLLLDAGGAPLGRNTPDFPLTIAVGAEGGLEDSERTAALAAGWQPVSLAPTTLRFETAGAVAIGVLRAR